MNETAYIKSHFRVICHTRQQQQQQLIHTLIRNKSSMQSKKPVYTTPIFLFCFFRDSTHVFMLYLLKLYPKLHTLVHVLYTGIMVTHYSIWIKRETKKTKNLPSSPQPAIELCFFIYLFTSMYKNCVLYLLY